MRDLALIKVSAKPETRSEIANLANIFRAKIVDVAPDSVIVEIAGTEEKIEGLVELLRPIGITEMVRTGQIAMLRGDSSGVRYIPGANGHSPKSNNHTKEGSL
jgi:acetolactate synthase-1/3 small subunit